MPYPPSHAGSRGGGPAGARSVRRRRRDGRGLAAGTALGPPLPDLPDGWAEWAFGLLPAPGGDFPAVAWTHRDRIHVHDLRTEVVVWDARTGDRLGDFGVWLGHWTAIDRWILHATPATGPFVGLTCDTDRVDVGEDGTVDVVDAYYVSVLDVERGEEIAWLPSLGSRRAVFAQGPDGTVLVQPDHAELLVRRLDGELLAALKTPGPCDQVAAASLDGRLAVVAGLHDEPGVLLAWDAASCEPSLRVEVPAPVNAMALAPGGALAAATDEGLYTTRLGL